MAANCKRDRGPQSAALVFLKTAAAIGPPVLLPDSCFSLEWEALEPTIPAGAMDSCEYAGDLSYADTNASRRVQKEWSGAEGSGRGVESGRGVDGEWSGKCMGWRVDTPSLWMDDVENANFHLSTSSIPIFRGPTMSREKNAKC